MSEPHIVILGGGPAGCAAAFQLRRRGRGSVTLVEQESVLGGVAASFQSGGHILDYGSHRLHSACDPSILLDIKNLLGDDLAHRDRHGRIRLCGKWLHFPLKTTDLMLRLDKKFAFGVVKDMVSSVVSGKANEGNTFASVLKANLGSTICENFYFPYIRKLWGHEPEDISEMQARKRVSAGSFSKLVKRLVKPPGAGKYYYPRFGFGQISEIYARAAQEKGAEILLDTKAIRLEAPKPGNSQWIVEVLQNGSNSSIQADYVWSTIPITMLTNIITPLAPPEVLEVNKKIKYRGMIFVYLELDVDQFTSTDAHYFPEKQFVVTRLSEPKNYFGLKEPIDRTVLCAELPCMPEPDDALWSLSDKELGARVVDDMRRAELPLTRLPISVKVKRLTNAYPIYTHGYDENLEVINKWLEGLPNLLVYGRQGLFVHDNTHHALVMAYSAVDCLKDGHFNHNKWNDYCKIFATHVVED